MSKWIRLSGLLFAAPFCLTSCLNEENSYSAFNDSDGNTYRMNDMTGEVYQLKDGILVKLTEQESEPDPDALAQAAVIEDFELAIRFLDGNYDESFGEYGMLDCVHGKPIESGLNMNRTRAELADVLVTCMTETGWFEEDRPAQVSVDSSIPLCADLPVDERKDSICMSEPGSGCDHKEYWGDGMFICGSDDE